VGGGQGWWVVGGWGKKLPTGPRLAFGIGILVSVWGLQLTGLCCSCSRCRSRRWRRCLRRRRLVVVYRIAR